MQDTMSAPVEGARDIADDLDRPSHWSRISIWLRNRQGPVADDASAVEPPPADHSEPDDPQPPAIPAEPPTAAAPERRINEWATRRAVGRTRAPRIAPDRSGWAIAGVVALAVLVLVIVVVGLNVSLGPLRDTALAVHIDQTAATLWWIGVDGLVVVAIISAVVLRHDPWARFYALCVVVFFTSASGFLQYLHGLGLTAPDQATGAGPQLPKEVVALVAVLVIGTIFCATHLLVYVLRHLFPGAMADQRNPGDSAPAERSENETERRSEDSDTGDGSPAEKRSGGDQEPPAALEPDPLAIAKLVYAACLDAEVKLSRKKLAEIARISERQAGHIRTDVEIERQEAAERERLAEQERAEAERLAAAEREAQRDSKTINGSPVVADLTAIGGA